jgi:2-polyprenyl-6-methoxyphenol hydroxylase-like FAD-dependent oxidoreductase
MVVYDVIVVGARCAGSPLAMLLARSGYKVLVVDRATFPSDTLSTHQIQVPGVARLQRWGLLEAVRATNAPSITRVHFDQGPGLVLDGEFPRRDGAAEAFSVRRTRLDPILLQAAQDAGAEVREGFTVEEVIFDDGHVAGIRGRTRDGTSVTETARVVVGADGKRSVVAHAVDAPRYREQPAHSCAYYAYFANVVSDALEIYGRDRRALGIMPTNDGLVCVYTAWPHAEYASYRADIEGNFLATLDLVPEVAERLRHGTRAERIYGTADLPNFFRRPFGPGWALVGDAGYVLDPLTGQGIADAFRDAERLAAALDTGFRGRTSMPKALSDYEKRRNAAALPMYEMTTQLASFAPPPPQNRVLLKALQGNQAQINRFLGVITGSIPMAEFFSPPNLISILGPLGFARLALMMARTRPPRGGSRVAVPTSRFESDSA